MKVQSTIRKETIAKLLDCSLHTASDKIKQLNRELKALGYMTMEGRVSSAYFAKRCCLTEEEAVKATKKAAQLKSSSYDHNYYTK